VSETRLVVFTEEVSLALSPNPTIDYVSLRGDYTGPVTIVDDAGRIVAQHRQVSSRIDVRSLGNGLYFVIAGEKILPLIKQ